MTATQKLQVGSTVEIKKVSYTIMKEKGDLYYASSNRDEMLHILRQNDTAIATKVPTGIFRLGERKKAEYPNEFEIQKDKILIWGVEFTLIGEPTFSGETVSFLVEYKKTGCITLNVRFRKMILDSAIAG